MSCNFPAERLAMYLKEVARDADSSSFPWHQHAASNLMLQAFELGHAHKELTGCTCFEDAMKQRELEKSTGKFIVNY